MEFYRALDEGSHVDEAFIIPLGDTHIGDAGFRQKELKKTLERGAQIGALFVFTGDILNNGLKSSVSDTYDEAIPPGDPQIDYAYEIFKPYKNLIVGAVSGNHEYRSKKDSNMNPLRQLCHMLDVPFFGDEVLLQFRLGLKKNKKPVTYTAYVSHGCSNGSTVGAKSNGLSRMTNIVLADIYFGAHTHQIMAYPLSFYVPDQHNLNVVEIEQWCVSGGGYLGRTGYPIRKNMRPVLIGSPTVRLDGRERRVEVTL